MYRFYKNVYKTEIEYLSTVVDQKLMNFDCEMQSKINKLSSERAEVSILRVSDQRDVSVYMSKFAKSKDKVNLYYPSFYSQFPALSQAVQKNHIDKVVHTTSQTMSIRTLFVEDDEEKFYIKFSYPDKLGAWDRTLRLSDVKYALYVSDSLRQSWNDEKLKMMWIDSVVDFHPYQDYRYLIREAKLLRAEKYLIPLANYVYLISQKSNNAIVAMNDFILPILDLVLEKYVEYYHRGVSFEFHGQNLLVEIESLDDPTWTGYLVYRDFENVGLDHWFRIENNYASEYEKEIMFGLKTQTALFRKMRFNGNIFNLIPATIVYPLSYYLNDADDEASKLYKKLLKRKGIDWT